MFVRTYLSSTRHWGITKPMMAALLATKALANGFICKLGTNGEFRAFTLAPTNFIADVTGYFMP